MRALEWQEDFSEPPGLSMIWRAEASKSPRILTGATLASAMLSAAFAAALLLLPLSVFSLGPAILSLLALAAAAACGTLLVSIKSLRYRLGRGSLELAWLSHRVTVPYAAIDGVFSGNRVGSVRGGLLVGVAGSRIGRGRDASGKPAYLFTSTSEAQALTVVSTDAGVFVLSPSSAADFRRELIRRIEAADEHGSSVSLSVPPWSMELLHDPLAVTALGLALVLLLAMLAVFFGSYASLPDQLAIQVDASGQLAVTAPRAQLFVLPALGGTFLILNPLLGYWLYAAEPVLARLLWLAAPLIELLLLISLIRVLP